MLVRRSRLGLALACAAALLAVPSALGSAPSLTSPGDITAEATSAAGAVVTFEVHGDAGGDPFTVTCDPASGSTFPVGATQVACTATNSNTSETSSTAFVVRVVDTKPPVISALPAEITLEATSKDGAPASYPPLSATDVVDGTVPVTCTPPPGSTLPLGGSQVTCKAVDSHGNEASGHFSVNVRDTKPPVFSGPAGVVKSVNGGATVKVSYALPRAVDVVDGAVTPTCTPAPGTAFHLGKTTVTCRAEDRSKHQATFVFTLELRDSTPPPQVRDVTATQSKTGVTVSWRVPSSTDFAGVVVVRKPGGLVYRGTHSSFVDHTAKSGVSYAYAVLSFDFAGNRSAPVVAESAPPEAAPPTTLSPPDGAQLKAPPLLQWPEVAGADYYNVQLFRAGKKVLSIWPTANQLKLTKTWTYAGTKQTLAPGAYRWYVWPGFGALADAKYGKLIGSNTFVIAGQ